MSPVPLLRRRLIFKGPLNRKDYKPLEPSFLVNQGPKTRLWQILSEQFTRQAYFVTLVYDFKRDAFPKPGEDQNSEEKILDCDDSPGGFSWNELPDPGGKAVNSRPAIFIEGEKRLCSLLQSINYRFVNELIEEGFRFVNGNVVIYLTRYLTIPPEAQATEPDGKPKINRSLPPYESLIPFDGDNKWVMMAKLEVSNGNDPELMRRGTEELLAVKADFQELFDLQARDRLIFDTRVRS